MISDHKLQWVRSSFGLWQRQIEMQAITILIAIANANDLSYGYKEQS
jgi:hypothetical protein